MALAAKAAGDRSAALTPAQIERAVRTVSERDRLDFSSGHGLEQRRIIDALGTGGRFAVAVGVGGAGKTTLLRPLVEAWTNPHEPGAIGREVYGTALAWRQSTPLADAGIKPQNAMAIAALLHRAERGKLALDRNSVVVVDELSQIGTAQALKLARLQDKHGFSIVAIGDDRQAQAIEAGSTIRLLRKALGNEAVPELESTVRQRRDRDKETTLMFRQGDAADGIARLREDGHAVLVQGGRRHAIEAAADLWEARQQANAGRDGYTLTVSAPTNSDARAISTAIRERRRKAGQLGRDEVKIEATDQNGAQYEMPLAVGDRVRLFARTHATFGGQGRQHRAQRLRGRDRADCRGRRATPQRQGHVRFREVGHTARRGQRAHSPDLWRCHQHRRHPVRHLNGASERAAERIGGGAELQELRGAVAGARDDLAGGVGRG